MLKHYYHPLSRAVTTDWMLREVDAEHEQVIVDFRAGENQTADYRAINAMEKIPALVDNEVVVTEEAAICAYLADKFSDKGLAPPLTSPVRGQYYRYLFYPSAVLEPVFSLHQAEASVVSAQSAGWGDLDRCLATIADMTPNEDWALGEQFSAADVVFGGTLDFAIRFGWFKDPIATVEAYVDRLRSRAAYIESHASFGDP